MQSSLHIFLSFVFAAALLGSIGCEKDKAETLPAEQAYSFFVAGHTYGNGGDQDGLYPLFRKKFDLINGDSLIHFGVLTGDIVKHCTEEDWDKVDRDLKLINRPVYFVAGNHDVQDRDLYESRYGQTYYSFKEGEDLFIVLDSGLENWNISGDQWDFLTGEVSSADGTRIFILIHHLLWWSPDNQFRNERPNSLEGRDDSLNFWTEVEPFLKEQSQDIYLIAGDIGAYPGSTGYFYYQYENLTLIASGMGNGPTDNIVIADVLPNGIVDFRLVALWGDDVYVLGDLEDYELR